MLAGAPRKYFVPNLFVDVIMIIQILNNSLHEALYQRDHFLEHQMALRISIYHSHIAGGSP
jgi:hypothetical protein